MAKYIERSALVPFTALQMYELVNDIEAFPEFMEGCVGSEIIEQGVNFMEARLDLRKGGMAHSFATRNQLIHGERIEMQLSQGDAFKSLTGVWDFKNLGDVGCKVNLQLEFEFKNKLIALAAEPFFEQMANQLVDAVCRRANSIYQA